MKLLLVLILSVSMSLAVHDFVLENANNDFTGFRVSLDAGLEWSITNHSTTPSLSQVYRTIPTEEYQTEFLENLQETSKVNFFKESDPSLPSR